MRILICDDDPAYRLLVGTVLRHEVAAEVVGEAGDGEAAVALARRTQPDVVLLDLEMPAMDGATALPLIRAVAPQASVIVLSNADRTKLVVERLRRLGASRVLSKPQRIFDLPRQVEDAVAGS